MNHLHQDPDEQHCTPSHDALRHSFPSKAHSQMESVRERTDTKCPERHWGNLSCCVVEKGLHVVCAKAIASHIHQVSPRVRKLSHADSSSPGNASRRGKGRKARRGSGVTIKAREDEIDEASNEPPTPPSREKGEAGRGEREHHLRTAREKRKLGLF